MTIQDELVMERAMQRVRTELDHIDQAERVVQALRRRPRLLYDVEKTLRREKPVMGPWELHQVPLQPDGKQRKAATRNVTATVRPRDDGAQGFYWDVWDEIGRKGEGNAPTMGDAQIECDCWLVENDYLLVDGAPG